MPSQDFQFFDPALAQLQERELAVFKVRTSSSTIHCSDVSLSLRSDQRLNNIPATVRESQSPEDTPEKLEAERAAAQEFIDTGRFTVTLLSIPAP